MSAPGPPEPPLPPVDPAGVAQPPPGSGLCPRCGAAHEPLQEYCLECGHRLPGPYALQRTIWSRDSPVWLWAALAALLLVALVAGALVAVAATGEDGEAGGDGVPVVSAGPGTTNTLGTLAPGTVTIQLPTTTAMPTTTFATTTLGTTTVGTTTLGTTTTANVVWPAGRDGYTIVLRSVPTSEGRSQADAAAGRARSNGLTQVGVLNSSEYSSLRPGYWVTFTGIYDTQRQAASALPNARSRGFPLAYVREIRD